MLHKKPERMALPMSVTFLTSQVESEFVAHSLDFDVVAVADSRQKALEKLKDAVKLYVEHGIHNRWEDDILFSAPEKYWARLTVDTPISIGEPIVIDDRKVRVFNVESTHEHRIAVGAA